MASMRAAYPAVAAAILGAAACTSGPSTAPETVEKRPSASSPSASSPVSDPGTGPNLGAPGCDPPSPLGTRGGFSEVQGTGSGASLWGLIMGPLTVGHETKIVWRMTGSGALRLTAIDPTGGSHPPSWGPVSHGTGSNYDRPGEEWGAGYTFTTAGRWNLRAERGPAIASVWIHIRPS